MTRVEGFGCLRGLVQPMGQPLGPLDWGSSQNKEGQNIRALQ